MIAVKPDFLSGFCRLRIKGASKPAHDARLMPRVRSLAKICSRSIAEGGRDMGGSAKKPGNTHEVLPHHEGGWDVKRDGAGRAYRHFDLKQDAIDCARAISKNQGTELEIKNKQGVIIKKDSHGNDPNPPKG
jgi:hypothetical protein